MADSDPIELARQTIGAAGKDDYVIAPTRHAEEFKVKAPELSTILSSNAVQITAGQFEERDQEANDAQAEFKRIFNRSNAAVLITAILIAFVLITGVIAPLLPATLVTVLLAGLGIASALTAALAAFDLNKLKQGKLLDAWMLNRARAESARLEYFSSVAKRPKPATTGGNSIELLKLEYFRRYQFDVQRAYYRTRSKDQRRNSMRTLSYSSFAIAGAAVATALAGSLGFISPKFSAIAALGSAFTALSSFSAVREEVYQNQGNAARYSRTSDALDDIAKTLDDVRIAVNEVGEKPLIEFIEAVHEQLSLEHRQWLGLQAGAENAFTKLEDTLKKIPATSRAKE